MEVAVQEKASRASSRYLGRLLLSSGLLISFFVVFVTSVFKIPDIYKMAGLTYRDPIMVQLSFIRDWGGVVLGLLIATHVIIHRRWFISVTRIALKKMLEKYEI